MPIVVGYDAIDALGGAALQSGYQQGYAGGQQNYLQRQQADTHLLLNNAFQRQRDTRQFGYGQIEANQQRDFQQGQRANEQDFQAGQRELDRRAQIQGMYGQAAIHTAQDERNFQQQKEAMNLQDRLTGQRQITNLNDQQAFTNQEHEAARHAKDNEFVDSYMTMNPSAPADEVFQALAQNRLDQQSRTGTFAPRGGRSTGQDKLFPEVGTLSGDYLQRGVIAADMGDYKSALDAAAQDIQGNMGGKAVNDVLQGIYVRTKSQPTQQLEAYLSVATPEVRKIIEAELSQRGAMQFGSNQARPQGGGGFVPAQQDPRFRGLSPQAQQQLMELDRQIMQQRR